MKRLAAALLLLSAPAAAQDAAQAGGEDARVKIFASPPDGLLHLLTAPDTIQTILFAPAERVQSVVLSNPDAYKVAVAGSGDALSLHAMGYLPPAIMTVLTDRASYQFELVPSQTSPVPAIVMFASAPPITQTAALPPPPQLEGFSYRLSGRRSLQPRAISDDGTRTYIGWSDEQAMPAVFAVGPGGKEEMVDGYMRGKTYTIERVFERLVFRIDSYTAGAERTKARGRND